jgi:hypothetical protein
MGAVEQLVVGLAARWLAQKTIEVLRPTGASPAAPQATVSPGPFQTGPTAKPLQAVPGADDYGEARREIHSRADRLIELLGQRMLLHPQKLILGHEYAALEAEDRALAAICSGMTGSEAKNYLAQCDEVADSDLFRELCAWYVATMH